MTTFECMYGMSHFTETDRNYVIDFMKVHPFTTLLGSDGSASVATQLPMLISQVNEDIILRGHMMRNTDHYKAIEKNNDVLVLFTGPQCYVSSSWYSERGTGGTWNYITVHARGMLRFLDQAETITILSDLTRHFEQGQRHPELVEHMPPEYINTHIKAIAGFEIVVRSLDPIFKLSQNKDDKSYEKIVNELNALNDYSANEIADEMLKRRPHLFTS